MSTRFRKPTKKRPQFVYKKQRVAARKRTKVENAKIPVARVGEARDHHDTNSTRVLYVLVDQPKDPQDYVVLEHSSQKFPMLATTDAEDLYDTVLVFVLIFEHVPDTGKFTLKLQRGDPLSEVALFTGIDAKSLFLGDIDLLIDFNTMEDKYPGANRRLLKYDEITAHPYTDDKDLVWPEGPYASVTEGESQPSPKPREPAP